MDENNIENKTPEQISTLDIPAEPDASVNGNLLKKRKLKRAATCKKPTEKPKWNGFAFLNDKKRDILMQVPEVPKTKKSKKKKTNRFKSAASKEEISNKSTTNKENQASDTESTCDKSERRNSNSDSAKSIGKSTSDESNDAKASTTSSKSKDDTKAKTKSPVLKRPKFKTTVDLDKINFDNEFNYREDVNYKIEEALNNLHVSTTYKNLVRSMKANV